MQYVEKYPLYFMTPRGDIAAGEVLRYLSPMTADKLLHLLPIRSMVIRRGCLLVIEKDIREGVERGRRSLSTGEIAYSPLSKAIMVALCDVSVSHPVNLLGRVVDNLPALEKLQTGESIVLHVEPMLKAGAS